MTAGNIVLIEDEEALRTVLQRLLAQHGYTVTTAANGQEGIQCLQGTVCDLVITDVMMEELSGFEVMEYIAAHAPDIPVIVITGYTSTASVTEALRKGAYDYITKPFHIATLLRPIERALEKVRLQRQLQQRMEELTQRVADLQATTVSKRFVENIIRSMADMLVVLQADLSIQTVNEAVTRILGYSQDELLGKPFGTICLPDIFFELLKIEPGDVTLTGQSMEKTYIARDGRQVPVSFSWAPLIDEQGALQGIVCIAQDITERRRTAEALIENEARLRLLTGQMPAMLWTTDTALQLTTFLGTDLTRRGFSPAQTEGLPLDELFSLHGAGAVATSVHTRALQGESVTQEIPHGACLFHAHVEPLRDAAGRVIGTIGVALDISERRRQEGERRKIAYELHDGAAQLMVSAQQHLDTCEVLWPTDAERAREHLLKGMDRLGQAIIEARRLMAQLHSVALETQGLVAAVQRYLENLDEDTGWESECIDQIGRAHV